MKSIKIRNCCILILLILSFSGGIFLNSAQIASAKKSDDIIFLLPNSFNPEEFTVPKNLFEKWGYSIVYCGLQESVRSFTGNITVNVNQTVSNMDNIADCDCIYVLGAMQWFEFGNNADVIGLLNDASDAGLLLSAICAGTYVLGCAGLLQNKTVTGYDKHEEEYASQGAIYQVDKVIQDGNIITAAFPYMEQMSYAIHYYLHPEIEVWNSVKKYVYTSAIGCSAVLGIFFGIKSIKSRKKIQEKDPHNQLATPKK